ncbi:MAG: DUF3987 domain-containing protein [Verrucomicrobia bacterium]|nr:DUF3987 domain-containing protein [Verrucomicrobiota bacterium]
MIYDPNSTDAVSNQDVLKSDPNDFLEQMPLYLLPKPFADMAEAIVLSARVPPSLAGCCVLGALSASIGSGLRVKSGPDRYSSSNLYLLTSASSGSGKSEAFRHALAPFFDAERAAVDHWRQNIQASVIADKIIVEAKIDELKKQVKKADGPLELHDIKSEMERLQTELLQLEIDIKQPCYSSEDATSEVIAIRMQNSSESLALLSADSGSVINNIFGRYNKNGRTDESIYLKAWSGDSCKVDRVQRPPIILEQPRMSALFLVQPDKVDSLLSEKSFTEGGLIPRFLVCHTNAKPSPIPEEEYAIEHQTKHRYCEAIQALLRAFHDRTQPATVTPSKEAKKCLREYHNHIAERMADGDLKDITPFAARWAEQAWRIALCIHSGEHLDHAEDVEISQETAVKAIQLAEWFSHHQLMVLRSIRRQWVEDRCGKLFNLVQSNGGAVSFRNLENSHGFNRSEIDQITNQFPNRFEAKKEATGGRPSEILRINLEK